MKQMFDPGEHAREAIRRATAPARAAADRAVADATAPARAVAAAAVEQATAPARASLHQTVQQLAAAVAPRGVVPPGLVPQVLAMSASAVSPKAVAMSAGYVDAVNAIAAGIRSTQPEYERAAEAARTALADMAAQIDFSAFGLAGAGGGRVPLSVRPVRAATTVSRPLLSVPATSEPDTMDVADLRDLLYRLWSAFYAAASNPAVQFLVGTLINLVVLGYAIAAYDTAVAAYEQDRDNNAVEQQRDATPPTTIVQPAPVIVLPEQRGDHGAGH
ncbi:hypothetical protein [Pseudonocardia endophytica]|nr:hypothetical protein [Pseudonocardia endophytica]